jgi:hypothetical protein
MAWPRAWPRAEDSNQGDEPKPFATAFAACACIDDDGAEKQAGKSPWSRGAANHVAIAACWLATLVHVFIVEVDGEDGGAGDRVGGGAEVAIVVDGHQDQRVLHVVLQTLETIAGLVRANQARTKIGNIEVGEGGGKV